LREFGDFQTPAELVNLVLQALHREGLSWARALEPTCGAGSFIKGLCSLPSPPREIQGLEIQPAYVNRARAVAEKLNTKLKIKIHQLDLFKTNLAELGWGEQGPLLVVGNPPWVTNSELGSLQSENVPSKSNLKGLRGLDALTGASNFDIAEYIWMKLMKELAWAKPTIALLTKTTVARNLLRFAQMTSLPISGAAMYRIDARKWFDASADACLFRLDVGSGKPDYTARLYPSLEATQPDTLLSVSNGSLIANTEAYARLRFMDGQCALEWRQGLKHDVASIMELREEGGALRNKHGDGVAVEDEFVFPLIKSSDLHSREEAAPRYRIVVTQKRLGDDTGELRERAPRLWAYLSGHLAAFRSRRSSIYAGRPDFAMFGVGDYSFSRFKVAVSGLYKTVRFRVLGPFEGKPIMLDDTCYFVPCESPQQACALVELLSHKVTAEFLNSIIFTDSKRPLTKRVLQRLDLDAILNYVDKDQLLERTNFRLLRLGAKTIADTAALHQYVFQREGLGGTSACSRDLVYNNA
jgi:hypothetical protein